LPSWPTVGSYGLWTSCACTTPPVTRTKHHAKSNWNTRREIFKRSSLE